MARFQWQDLPTKIDLPLLIRLLNKRMAGLRAFFTGFVRLESGYRISRYLELPNVDSEPVAPEAGVRLFVLEDGTTGKQELWARFRSGATQKIAQEP